jgi:hypothetical protein
MKITVREQIMSGNMGDGWDDNYEAANSYADFLAPILLEDVQEQYPDAEIVVALTVERMGGASRGIVVDVDGVDEPEQIFEVPDALAEMLVYTEQDAWGKFCDAEAVRAAASTMGRKGGKSKSDAKAAAARENGKRGGRPRKEVK